MSLLELDAGNTRIKWRLTEAEEIIKSGSDLKGQLSELKNVSPQVVWVSSVHTQQNQWIIERFPKAQFAKTSSQAAGLQNSYEDVSRMGVDRWLAMLAAYQSAPDDQHIVVDAGTALTIDLISGHHHVGGYICPGTYMMKQSILGQTQQVRADIDWSGSRTPGTSTQECLDHGILDMACSWIERQSERQPEAKLWLTGGNAEKLATLLTPSLVLEPDLVLNGLQIYFSE